MMRKEYDFSNSRKNPYASQLKKQITIRLDEDSITYFKAVSEEATQVIAAFARQPPHRRDVVIKRLE